MGVANSIQIKTHELKGGQFFNSKLEFLGGYNKSLYDIQSLLMYVYGISVCVLSVRFCFIIRILILNYFKIVLQQASVGRTFSKT